MPAPGTKPEPPAPEPPTPEPSVVQVVHCIDTEGGLREPLDATFERLRAIFGIDLPPSRDTLERLQRREVPLNGLEAEVAQVVSSRLMAYNDGWPEVDAMLERIMAPAFRDALPDSFGGGWRYSWHCVDHVGFLANPRDRDLGHHKVFDHYREAVARWGQGRDAIHFHHHPVPFSRAANHCATHYFSHAPAIFEILARKIIDRDWFPSVYRPGFHTIRPDSHWLLEQFIPFDIANQATDDDATRQRDMTAGRYGDWRRAPRHWAPYHPHHDDWQAEGACRRWVARCLNVGTRTRLLRQDDVDQAFAEARAGRPVILAFADHDFRDMAPDVDDVRALLASAAARFPDVRFRYAESRQAFRDALKLPARPAPTLSLTVADGRLHARASAPIFGPQPFLALKRRDGAYFHDNLDFQEPFREWTYVFDEQTVPVEALEAVGLGACDEVGNVTVEVWDAATGQLRRTHH